MKLNWPNNLALIRISHHANSTLEIRDILGPQDTEGSTSQILIKPGFQVGLKCPVFPVIGCITRKKTCRGGLVVKTQDSQACGRGSILVRVMLASYTADGLVAI